ncbi:MAG: NADPH-dependent reductase [Modestobacter sp.]|nr:NADPH-dependent reductase [Modestobacter sp.]
MSRPVLQVVVASTRPGRKGVAVARWVAQLAGQHGGFDAELVDLAEVGLPVFDEPNHPRLQQYTHQHTRDWSATVSRGDAYVFVTPEYNHSFPASLKNALDFLHVEWADKAAALVSYGGVSAGLRAAGALKPVLAALRMVPVVEAATIPFFQQFLTEDDQFVPNEQLETGGTAMLDELLRLTTALRPLRAAARPDSSALAEA